MSWSVEAITAATSDTEPSILVTFDEAKYLFNAGENLSRAWLQSPRGWKNTRAIFLTSTNSRRASGIPGLLMFLADGGNDRIQVVGPTGLLHYLASMRTSLARVTMQLTPTEVPCSGFEDTTPGPVYADERVKIYAQPIYAAKAPPEEGTSVPMKRKRSLSPEAPAKRANTADDTSADPDSDIYDTDPQAWRRLMVSQMFPFKAPEASTKRAARKERLVQSSYDLVGMPLPESLKPTPPPPQVDYSVVRARRARRLPSFAYGPEGKSALCYVLVGPTGRGRFDVAKAEALGVPRGPLRGQLTKGETVMFPVDDGHGNEIERTVKPEDVLGLPEIPRAMVVLDVPSPAHIPSLVESFAGHPFYSKFCSKRETADRSEPMVHVVIHLCGKGVLEDEQYKAFMRVFPEDTHHVISSRGHADDPVVFTKVAFHQLRLNQLDPYMFPIPQCSKVANRDLKSVPGLPERSHRLYKHCIVEVRPPKEPCLDPLAKGSDRTDFVSEADRPMGLPQNLRNAMSKARAKVTHAESARRTPRSGDNVEVVPLGTSSSTPTLYRNVASTLVRIPEAGSLLLDCGEGTWGQLARMYGDDGNTTHGAWEVLRDLRCVFVSHMHGDHHLGLRHILAQRRNLDPAPTQPLYVVGLVPHIMYLQELHELEDIGLDQADGCGVKLISSDHFNWRAWKGNTSKEWQEDVPANSSRQDIFDMYNALGLKKFQTVDVPHKCKCYGAVFEHRDGWSIAFSADCMPSKSLIQTGRDATLLIHEATLADDQEEMAREKAHSTFSQAVQVGLDMGAENILLTHFSARYPRIPPTTSLPASPKAGARRTPNLGIAFDCTRVKIGDMWKLRHYLPAIEVSLGDVANDDDDGTAISTWD